MPIKIVPQTLGHEPAVLAFNKRLEDGGARLGFYSRPDDKWLPQTPGARTWREYFLAIEDDEHVRGAYALKPQQWLIGDQQQLVCDWQGPFSEGAINPKYATLAIRFIRDMLKRYPLLYSVGHGGTEEPMVRLLRSLGWKMYGAPFCLKILQPYRFLTRNGYLRRNSRGRALLNLAAWSGAGSIGFPLMQAGTMLIHGGGRSTANAVAVDTFGEWADTVWSNCRSEYRCLAIRDSSMMNTLIPESGLQNAIRLRIYRGETTLGWAVVHHAAPSTDPRFGELSVGLISDCFGALSDGPSIIDAATRYLEEMNVDLIYSNQSHPIWVRAFKSNGYLALPNRRLFACAPALTALLEKVPAWQDGLHMTNMDGHGPHGFG